LANIEKQLALDILKAAGLSPSKLGLRFDRVVVSVLADLRSFVEAAPGNLSVLVTISAPIRLPAATVSDLKTRIATLLAAGVPPADSSVILHGNRVLMRPLQQSANAPTRLVGFVHNPASSPKQLLDLAEQWLRAQT